MKHAWETRPADYEFLQEILCHAMHCCLPAQLHVSSRTRLGLRTAGWPPQEAQQESRPSRKRERREAHVQRQVREKLEQQVREGTRDGASAEARTLAALRAALMTYFGAT